MPSVARKPPLQVVREGNPGHQKIEPGLRLPPAELREPDWTETFNAPAKDKLLAQANRRAVAVASKEWNRVVPVLKYTAGLAAVDALTLHDYCVCVARIDQCERSISQNGMLIMGERGWQKNGATTVVAQYRAQLRVYVREFGLSPSARGGITPPDADDDGSDAFD